MPKVRTARNVRFVNSREQELHCRRVERRLETDSWGIWWGSRAANRIAVSTLVAHQLQSQRRVMAVQLRDMAFHKHDIDHWMHTLPTFASRMSIEKVEFLLTESVWDFLLVCWAKYRSGDTFSYRRANNIRDQLDWILTCKKYNSGVVMHVVRRK